ncbi:hypothetical protein JRO89_XS06G0102500 [Xanthoceras sorbifolium]|uniref:Uncharacterized protein n=1 Tax=Xanthoceras sorbifolium TaxID=99658 RepID=A0ABQ8HXP0_9ROSI|nr:hypothetical protein JRO89_XS06G0102500 [Xanthoceras sorbifolium]
MSSTLSPALFSASGTLCRRWGCGISSSPSLSPPVLEFRTTLSRYFSGSKSDAILAGGDRDVAAALKEAVDPVVVLPCSGVGESIAAAVGVRGKIREEKIEVGLESAVSGEVLV